MEQNYCAFNGILKDESRWIEEFKMLEEPSDHPNFQKMNDVLSIFMILPQHLVESCPKLKIYLAALTKYHAQNANIVKEVKVALGYISQNKLASNNESEYNN